MKKLFTILLFIMTGLVAFAQSEGALPGLFSVSATKKVYFSKGNLQYQASTKTWRFAEHQYDYVGDESYGNVYENGVKSNNENISKEYTGWIDLFSCGNSGYGETKPYGPKNLPGGSIAGTNYDWGVYNAIQNGGNQSGLWRAFTNSEWRYLIYTRTNASKLFGLAKVSNVEGMVILPDNFVVPSALTFVSGLSSYNQNVYQINDWKTLEEMGAVFLPAAGSIGSGSASGTVNEWSFLNISMCYTAGDNSTRLGSYWTSSSYNSRSSYRFSFFSGNINKGSNGAYATKEGTLSVRLVQDATKVTITTTVSGNGTVSGGGQYYIGEEATLTATPATGSHFLKWSDGNTENPRVIIVSEDATYTAIFVSDTPESIMDVYQDCDLNVAPTNGILDGHEWVDLGLPSGNLWATCNVGANSPEEYGDYFAWGETEPKSDYSWSTYKYGSYSAALTKYCNNSSYGKNGFTDTLTVLEPMDDVATVNWGNGWRMPTFDEIQELNNKCSSVWTTQNGKNGRLFTGPNGNTLFLPAAGRYEGSSLLEADSCGNYWSSSLGTDVPYLACRFYFNSDNAAWGDYGRYFGRSVRPVVKR